jgi:hypothetical protein
MEAFKKFNLNLTYLNMKREYFLVLLFAVFFIIYFTVEHFFGEAIFDKYLRNYIIIWLLIPFYLGQYSMKFPKRF